MTKLELVKEKLKKVSPKDLDSVDEFIEKLIQPNGNKKNRKFNFDWKGALKEEKISSVDLQHEISKQWNKLD